MGKEQRTGRTGNQSKTLLIWSLTIIAGLALLYGAGRLARHVMSDVSPGMARAWALIATVLLPFVTWAGWWFGHTEARGRLAGIDQAVDKVMGAATRAASLRVGTAHALRQRPTPPPLSSPPPPQISLPPVEIIPRQQLISGEIIEV